ncbi:MAG TPA: DUF1573 domain-containing protein, partial [Geobacterales bacterium]|nr:DUF1573 domain-containing protein [Geobacterales bacterium]
LRNSGTLPLFIEKVSTSCGCTATTLSAPTVPPGKSADIQVRFDTSNYAGTVTKMIYVASNDPLAAVTTLSLSGQIREELILTPHQITLGGMHPGERREVTITLENSSNSTISLTGFRASPQATVTLDSTPIAPKGRAVLRISITAPSSGNDLNLSGFVGISTTYPAKPEVIIPFYGALLR